MIKGRIIKGVGGIYWVRTEKGTYQCSARGKFRKARITPTVGDFVQITIIEDDKKTGSVDKIEKRENELLRPRVANIHCAVITFAAAAPDINYELLDRFLLLSEARGIPKTIICINKSELGEPKQMERLKEIYSPLYPVLFVSAAQNTGIDRLFEEMGEGVAVLAGPSGVGKSSLINLLVPQSNRQTGEISRKIERGKHTTRQVELLDAGQNRYIVDSPGFTSLTSDFIKSQDLQYYFKEFRPYLGGCRFNDCIHINEPDCQIKSHIGDDISSERYDRFITIFNELKENENRY